jgi:hypothetical protein
MFGTVYIKAKVINLTRSRPPNNILQSAWGVSFLLRLNWEGEPEPQTQTHHKYDQQFCHTFFLCPPA